MPGQAYWEPFVGGAWVMALMDDDGPRVASDICMPLIVMYQELQQGWQPPTEVDETMYAAAKRGDVETHLQAFIGFGCSFAGKWFGGYARSGHGDDTATACRSLERKFGRNYAANAANSCLKTVPSLKSVEFFSCDYRQVTPTGQLIYCDPPYAGTTGYAAAGKWDSAAFWDVMGLWVHDNTVIVSEYAAPEPWRCVLEIPTRTDIRNARGELEPRVERLFQCI